MQAPGPARARRARRLLVLGSAAVLGLLLAPLAARPLGPSLIRITSPTSGITVANEAVEVLVSFPHGERTHPETLRVRLNGADVTDDFDVAGNGAVGKVVRVLDGENTLEVAVFGRAWWPGSRLVEHTSELRFRVARPFRLFWA